MSPEQARGVLYGVRARPELPDACLMPIGNGVVPNPRLGMVVRLPVGGGRRFYSRFDLPSEVSSHGIPTEEWRLLYDEYRGYFWQKETR